MTTRELDRDEVLKVAREAAQLEVDAVAAVPGQIDDSLVDVIELILARPGKVIVIGAGTSGSVARRLAHLLSVSGTPAVFIPPADALHGTMGAVEPQDVLIGFSKGGESDEINNLSRLLKETGTAIVGVGEAPGSTHAQLSDVYVAVKTSDQADPENILAMGSTLVASTWGDALTRALMYLHDWDVHESLRIHPGGAVGKHAEDTIRRIEDQTDGADS